MGAPFRTMRPAGAAAAVRRRRRTRRVSASASSEEKRESSFDIGKSGAAGRGGAARP